MWNQVKFIQIIKETIELLWNLTKMKAVFLFVLYFVTVSAWQISARRSKNLDLIDMVKPDSDRTVTDEFGHGDVKIM